MSITDHKGNEFSSFSAMIRHYNLPANTVRNRLSRGWTLEQALTISNNDNQACKLMPKNNQYVFDHLGNKYKSIKEMAEHYGITEKQYWGRKRQCKWSLEKILTTPLYAHPGNTKKAIDHTGQKFESISAMCEFWHMTRSTFNARIKNGWTIEQALTTPQKEVKMEKQKWTDHKGKQYPSLNKMCEAYGITHHTFSTRLNKLGWSLEKALTTKKIINSIEIKDNNGNTFPSLADMAHYYHIPSYKLQGKKLQNVESLDEILIGFNAGDIINEHLSIKKQLTYPYFIVDYDNKPIIMTLNQILNVFHNTNFYPLPDRKIKLKNFEIKKLIKFPYYEVVVNNETIMLSYWNIIKYCHDNNFGI